MGECRRGEEEDAIDDEPAPVVTRAKAPAPPTPPATERAKEGKQGGSGGGARTSFPPRNARSPAAGVHQPTAATGGGSLMYSPPQPRAASGGAVPPPSSALFYRLGDGQRGCGSGGSGGGGGVGGEGIRSSRSTNGYEKQGGCSSGTGRQGPPHSPFPQVLPASSFAPRGAAHVEPCREVATAAAAPLRSQ